MRTVLCLSGGIDSAVLLYKLLLDGHEVDCLCIDYGQRCRAQEYKAAAELITAIEHGGKATLCRASFGPVLSKRLCDTSNPLMRHTGLHHRTSVLLSLAGAFAANIRLAEPPLVVYPAHACYNYPDNSGQFYKAVADVLFQAGEKPIKLLLPFTSMTKADIVKLGVTLKVPFHLTWSCLAAEPPYCGRCEGCLERLSAFHDAGITDPTTYTER